MDDWDLLAVVRGRSYNYNNMESPLISSTMNHSNNTIDNMELPSPKGSCFVPLRAQIDQEDDLLFNTLPHLFETATAFDELEELYKPFYPGPNIAAAAAALNASSLYSLSSPSSSVLSPSFVSLIPRQAAAENPSAPKPKVAKEPATKYKKRKNQQKRVVKEVREDGLGSDMWAWRKYGQKPIKGSPYPRSYYRCSSSKGCSARKQVERSPSKPDLFIITYTADHTHPQPSRRNSLAGTTRVKFPVGPQVDPDPGPNPTNNNNNNCEVSHELGQSTSNTIIKMDCDDHDHDHEEDSFATTSDQVELKSSSQRFFASLDDLERGLEELDCEDQASNNENINNVESELLLLDDELFFDNRFIDSNCNWFVDQYNNTTVTGAC